jgi:glycosyltransferase involved in cell wall biosynthesis
MRVAVANLTGGGFSGGYRKYLDRLVPLLADDPRVSAVQVYGPGTAPHQISQPFDPDVFFIPTARWLDVAGAPVVPMVRNMEPLAVPLAGNGPMESLRNLARARVARRACRQGDRIIAVSSFVRDFLVERWSIDTAKIGVVEHGVDPPMALADTVRPAALEGPDVPGFAFTAGSLRPARGLEDAIRALGELRGRGVPMALVVAGSTTPATRRYEQRMRGLARECSVEGQVLWAGELAAPEMAWCFRHCLAFVMTSRAEACPNLLLEAMAHGCACISVDRRPMTEMLGPAGRYYSLGSGPDLARQLSAAAALDADARGRLRRSTLERAAGFDWHRTAEKTVDQLELARSASG